MVMQSKLVLPRNRKTESLFFCELVGVSVFNGYPLSLKYPTFWRTKRKRNR